MSKNKNWIKVQKIQCPILAPEVKGEHIVSFFQEIFAASIETFVDEGIYNFFGLMTTSQNTVNGNRFNFINFFTNQPIIAGKVNLFYRKFIFDISENQRTQEFKIKYIEEVKNRHENIFKGWYNLRAELKMIIDGCNCFEFKINSYEKTYSVESISGLPLTPENYPNKGSNFLEAIKLLSVFLSNKILFIDDMEWFMSNKKVTKLLIFLLDNKLIDFNNLEINQNNLNEWRYLAPKVELELMNRKNASVKKPESNDTIIPNKKLSTYLNGYYSFHNIKEAKSDIVLDITFGFIKSAEEKIYKQPNIALRAIKVEMYDIHTHYSRYISEINGYIKELNTIVSKGPKLDEIDLKKVEILEDKRNVLADFINLLEDCMAYMMRMLLEHYSEIENDKQFLDKFSKYLGPFDWMSKRAEQFRNEFIIKVDHGSKPVSFERTIIIKSRKMIADNEVEPALELLLLHVQDEVVEKELILLKQQWMDFKKEKNLGLLSEEASRVTMSKIICGILSII